MGPRIPAGRGWPWLLAVGLPALLVRAFELGGPSLWIDEAFSAWVISHGMAEIWQVIPRFDTHPPLYYALLEAWTWLLGDSEAALRSLSLVVSLATVPVIHAAGRALAPPGEGPWLARTAAAILALAPLQVAYAQEARSYALLTFAAALALLGALRLMRSPDAARVPWLGWGAAAGTTRASWALLVGGWALCLWTHNLGALVVASFLPPLGLWWLMGRRDPALAGNLALAVLLALLLWSPNLGWVLTQAGDVAGGFWLAAPGWKTVARTLSKLVSLERLGSRDPWFLLVALELWGLVWLARNGRRAQALLLAALLALPILVTLAVSFALVPVFLDRTLIWVGLPGYLALAAGLVGLPRPRVRVLGLILVLALFGWATATYHVKKSKEPWRDVALAIAAHWQTGDVVAVAPPYGAKPMGYYWRRLGSEGEILVPRWEDPTQGLQRPEFERRLDRAARVWLVTRTEQGFDPQAYWVTRKLDQERERRWSQEFHDRLGLVLYGAGVAETEGG